jgi:hypothetical protein
VILASLLIYLVICIAIEENLHTNTDPTFPLETIRYALFGASLLTLIAVYFLRKILLKRGVTAPGARQTSSTQHLALAKYTVAVVATSALLESIGIYGVVLFLLAKDSRSLYQLLILSAAAMIYFRPRKDELMYLAEQMRK